MKFIFMTIAALFSLALQEPAFAQSTRQVTHQQAGFSGRCPVGACAKDGTLVAKNVKNCSPANCKK